jgi:hypothetical protein
MAGDRPCVKWTANQPLLHQQFSGRKETLLRGENCILELISIGAPLPVVLNKLCAAIDLQIANLVSVITMPDDQGHDLPTITQRAVRFGLHVFWSASIPLRDEDVLGWLEMYCCISRAPTPFELRLIERVTHLAALAIQRRNDEKDLESLSRNWTRAPRRGTHEWVYLN